MPPKPAVFCSLSCGLWPTRTCALRMSRFWTRQPKMETWSGALSVWPWQDTSVQVAADKPRINCWRSQPRPVRAANLNACFLSLLDLDREGTNGVSTNGVTSIVMLFDKGTFAVLPLTYFYLPKSARVYLFPQSVKFITFNCSAAPLVLTPFVRNQFN